MTPYWPDLGDEIRPGLDRLADLFRGEAES
ncbi:MAG: hypothetical protein JWN14_863 [Chthonomonadales bacterium]|nr:hypothetical protein [Chthonomonadales bacterium]